MAHGCARMVAAWREFRRCLASYPGPLPDFRHRLADAERLLGPGRSPKLRELDLAFLLAEQARIRTALAEPRMNLQPAHGASHRYNWLDAGRRALLIDLESACLGPVELDIAYLGCAEQVPGLDLALLALLRDAISMHVAVSCWARLEAVPELAWHAAHHLGVLRARAHARHRRGRERDSR
jgi:hypothetical protein